MRVIRYLIVFVVIIMLAGCGLLEKKDPYAEGMKLQAEGKYNEAIDQYREARKSSPNNPDIYFNVGKCFYELSKFEDAIKMFEKASTIKPENPEYYLFLGNTYLKQDYINEAIEQYEMGLMYDESHSEIHKNLAYCYEIIGDNELAAEHFRLSGDMAEMTDEPEAEVAEKPKKEKKPEKKIDKSKYNVFDTPQPNWKNPYTIQVGAYFTLEEARKIQTKLIASGYYPYYGKITKDDKLYYRVRVGAYKNKAGADEAAKNIMGVLGDKAEFWLDVVDIKKEKKEEKK